MTRVCLRLNHLTKKSDEIRERTFLAIWLSGVSTASLHLDLLLSLRLDQLQHPELLLCDVGQRDREPYILRVQNAEAAPHERAVGCVHRLFEPILGAARPVADIDGVPVRTAGGAAIQLRLRRVSAFPAAEDAVGAVFFTPTEAALM
jgi:hypothetical protein